MHWTPTPYCHYLLLPNPRLPPRIAFLPPSSLGTCGLNSLVALLHSCPAGQLIPPHSTTRLGCCAFLCCLVNGKSPQLGVKHPGPNTIPTVPSGKEFSLSQITENMQLYVRWEERNNMCSQRVLCRHRVGSQQMFILPWQSQ